MSETRLTTNGPPVHTTTTTAVTAETPTECDCTWCMGSGGSDPCEACLHDHVAEKDARIRELEATIQSAIRIYRQVESERRPNGKGLSPFFFGQRLRRLIREWVELSEAALARPEGGTCATDSISRR